MSHDSSLARSRRLRWSAVAWCAVLVGAASAARAQPTSWPGKEWAAARVVQVQTKLTPGADGEEIGVVELPTDLLARADGADIRVANAGGRLIPMRVLSVGPGSVARVAFEVKPGRNDYTIFYGSPQAAPPGKELALTISRGLLLETRTFAGGNVNSLAGVQRAFDRADIRQGADFVPKVFQGNNPFGPDGRTVSRYTGPIVIPADGEYGFATTSDDASFILIDGKLVVEWGGYHGWVGDARHNASVKLARGLHQFEYLHVNLGAEGGAVAAWKPPGASNWAVIPDSAFLPVFRGQLKDRAIQGRVTTAEVQFANLSEALIGSEDYIQRLRFTSSPRGFDPRQATFTWDFGDGITVSAKGLAAVDHVYLSDGPVTVTCTVAQGSDRDAVSNRVVVARDWPTIIQKRPDRENLFAQAVSLYDFTKMRPIDAVRAMTLFERTRRWDAYLSAGHALATACEPVDNRLLIDRMGEYARRLVERDPADGSRKVVLEYVAAARRATSPFARAAMLTAGGRVMLDDLNDERKAEQFFTEALKEKDRGSHPAIQAAWIGLGDVYRRRGPSDKALEAYEAAEKMSPNTDSAKQQAVRTGSLARTIEFYIRDKDYETAREYLEQWDREFPTQRLHGYSSLLWVRFYQAQGLHREAIREAQDLVAGNPRSNYAPELLMDAADGYVVLREPDKARMLLERVTTAYRESPLAAEAKKKLDALNKPASP
ncbi:MAG: hypothetical protein BIFFINMI_00691 [Phycisphaerae bacterium]|nr:hypothetical protein [Phycisphaerae bacterium]